ncbi:MAG: hypothetical protein ACOVMN_08955 [Flexibacteraceae bacterium]
MKILNIFIAVTLGLIACNSFPKSGHDFSTLKNKAKYNDTAWFVPLEANNSEYFLIKLINAKNKIIAIGFAKSKNLKPVGEWYIFSENGRLSDYRLFDKKGKVKAKPYHVYIDDDEPDEDPGFHFINPELYLDSIIQVKSEEYTLCFSYGIPQTLKSKNHIIMVHEDEGLTDSILVNSGQNPFFTVAYKGKLPSHIQLNTDVYQTDKDKALYSVLEKPFQLDSIKIVPWKGKLSELYQKSFNLREVMEYALKK